MKYRKVLIVENDYLQATDYRAAFEAAHCIVIGPVSNEDDALRLLDDEVVDIAIVDLNLGRGLSFRVAKALMEQDIPFCFATGYECKDLPEEFSTILCLSKPIDPPHLVAASSGHFPEVLGRRSIRHHSRSGLMAHKVRNMLSEADRTALGRCLPAF